MRIEQELKLGFKDVLFRPKRLGLEVGHVAGLVDDVVQGIG